VLTGQETPEIDRRLNGGRIEDGKFVAHSLSGNERNHLFLNRSGDAFEDISALSGLDTPSDGRGFVLLDYDHDGWQDIALVNANEPLLNLYHNEIGRLPSSLESPGETGGMIALRFVGGNRSPGASELGCRDGFGAMVTVSLDGTTLKREHRCGEGFATQNSATMILGIGARSEAAAVTVRWPSGKQVSTRNVRAGTLLTVYENPADAVGGRPFVSGPYTPAREPRDTKAGARVRGPEFPLTGLKPDTAAADSPTKLHVYTTMATWCRACVDHVPEMRLLESTLRADDVKFIGVPVDEEDDAGKLRAFLERWKPPYRLLVDLPATDRQAVTAFLAKLTRTEKPGVPTTIVTDRSGAVLLVGSGVPSVSVIRKLLLGGGTRD